MHAHFVPNHGIRPAPRLGKVGAIDDISMETALEVVTPAIGSFDKTITALTVALAAMGLLLKYTRKDVPKADCSYSDKKPD